MIILILTQKTSRLGHVTLRARINLASEARYVRAGAVGARGGAAAERRARGVGVAGTRVGGGGTQD